MARPTKYTPETADEIVAGIAVGLTDKDAALAAGICEKTLERWRKRFVDFDDRLTRARALRTRGWLQGVRRLATEQRDLRAYESLLDRCAPEYRKAAGVDVTHRGTVTHHHRDLSAFTDEQIAKLAAVAEEVKAGERTP